MKRLFDLLVTLSLLTLTVPLMLFIAIWLRLDSAGPILYTSPRLGRAAKPIGLLRFRTIDLHKPADLPTEQRLTRTGRFIRNLSLDDLPNLFNVLKGDLSIIGPRPTEPAVIDLADPAWQKVLTVRPGMIGWAILNLASTYNDTPWPRRLQLEIEYVDRQSLSFDICLLWLALRGWLLSRGNIKARGLPST
jgi:lipopolysaccharide/colanic/teichoic acid biosynthesis glycosyltransferase